MISRFKNFLRSCIQRLTTDPIWAGKTAFAGILIVGIFSLALEVAPEIMPRLIGARLMEPLTFQDVQDKKNFYEEEDYNKNWSKKKAAAVKDCYRKGSRDGSATSFLQNFEVSFAGVLPGAGSLILEHPATVQDRKTKLTFEIIKNYAYLKFCIPEEAFQRTYGSEFENDFVAVLDIYTQVRKYEKNKAPKDEKFEERLPIFFTRYVEELNFVKKDLRETHAYVVDILDRAIDSAIELDQQTQRRIANLTSQTRNQLLHDSGKRQNEIIEINTSIADLVQDVRDMTVWFNYFGGPMKISKEDKAYPGETFNSQLTTKAEAEKAIDLAKSLNVSYGLLNFFDKATRSEFLENRYATEMVLYYASIYWLDPLAPVTEFKNIVALAVENSDPSIAENIAPLIAQTCRLADEDVYKEKCFAGPSKIVGTKTAGPTNDELKKSRDLRGTQTQPTTAANKSQNIQPNDNLGGGGDNIIPVDIRKWSYSGRLPVEDINNGRSKN